MTDRTEGAVSPEDREKILASARDYIEGWLDGDADRMARCLHPALIKREALADDPSAASITRDQMVEATQAGRGPKLERPYSFSMPLGTSLRSAFSHPPTWITSTSLAVATNGFC